LGVLDHLAEGEADVRAIGSDEAEDGVEEVVGGDGEGESESTLFAANVEGEGDGEDD